MADRFYELETINDEQLAMLHDGDKVWCVRQTFVEVFGAGDALPRSGFIEERLFVASLNVYNKFKIYYGDFSWTPERVASYGRKLPEGNAEFVQRLFPELVATGWQFIAEHR